MSAAKMVADSTQDASDGRKKKKKFKKVNKKVALPEDQDSDLDLKKDLKPISSYLRDSPKMIDEMFHAVKGASLQRALPELLKKIPLEELKLLCLEQLEVMSKKRIKRILAGEESANISSSGTDDDSSEEEHHEGKSQKMTKTEKTSEEPIADSTSIHQETSQKMESDPPQVQPSNEQSLHEQLQPSIELIPDIQIKQELPDSELEGQGNFKPEPECFDDSEEEYRYDEQELEEEEEELHEAYTSGSEDGELVKKDTLPRVEGIVQVKQEVLTDSEIQGQEQEYVMDDDICGTSENASVENQIMEKLEGDLLSSMETNERSESGDMVLPSIMMDQMELLELEMRARAIKAMLTSQDEVEDG